MRIATFVMASVGASAVLFGSANAGAAYKQCATSADDTNCWRQITYTNFKDFAVGDNLVCMVGGNSAPASGSDPYLNPNSYSQNLGNEDVVECHNPYGHSGFEGRPIYLGTGTDRDVPTRVPGGVYDDGVWQGTPTGVIAIFGDRDDVAVLNSQQQVYVSRGDSYSPWSGAGKYSEFQWYRQNVDANTGATICIKGIFAFVPWLSSYRFTLMAHGCNGQTYVEYDQTYAGWLLYDSTPYKDVAGGYAWLYSLTTSNQVLQTSFMTNRFMPALPSGTPSFLGFRYVISSTSNQIYEAINTEPPSWTFRDVSFPESLDPTSNLRQIDSGERFRGNSGEFFVFQTFGRVYSYTP